MTGFTYFCTDAQGDTYTRYSANHALPRYFFASIFRVDGKPAIKANVRYSSRAQGLRNGPQPTTTTVYERNAADDGFDRRQVPATYEYVEVRAYAGRLKAEPVTA